MLSMSNEKRTWMSLAGLEHAKLFNKNTFAKNFFAALKNQ
jgi:hypothetical protein